MSSTDRRWLGRMAAVVGLVSTVFAACATGNQNQATSDAGAGGSSVGGAGGSGGGTGGSGGTGGMMSSGGVGSPCKTDEDCSAGKCTLVGNNKYCTVPCPPDCPAGTYCSIVSGDPTCIPDLGQQCNKCKAATDCASITDECFKAPAGDSFCAMDCTTLGKCPNGFTCMDKADYQAIGTDNGPDGGVDDAGTDGGKADGGVDAGKDAGPKPPPVPTKWCVPNDGASCPCTDKRDGITHDCHVQTPSGLCTGTETCDGKAGKWEGCTAATPKAETCNGKDDNCNGQVDEGDPNALCADQGGKPPNAGWVCSMGMCSLGPCDPGWAAFPPGPVSAGCSCPVEVGEPNGSCGTATNAGMVNDGGGSIVIQGTLSAANDVDFWTFDTTDTDEMTTNSYHVSIDFTAPMPNSEFVMDVIRGDACTDVPAGPGTNVTSYDWCVDGTAAGAGEAPCGNLDNTSHCADHSSKYFLRVYRQLGVMGTCTPYTITVTAKGGDACDFSKTCP